MEIISLYAKPKNMKRSKLFLAISSTILGVVGIAATKHFSGTTRYYLTTGKKYCACPDNELCKLNPIAVNICQTNIGPTIYSLYTRGPCGVIHSQSQCTGVLKYSATGE